MVELSPRDRLELQAFEYTGDPVEAAKLGEVADRVIEAHASLLAPLLGVPVGVLVEQLWAMVET